MEKMLKVTWYLLAATVLVAASSDLAARARPHRTPPKECNPGQRLPCSCDQGEVGEQKCSIDGFFGQCVCTLQPKSGPHDCSGHWKLGAEDEVVLVHATTDTYEIRDGNQGYGGPAYAETLVTRKGGSCVLHFKKYEGMQGHNSYSTYDLVEEDGSISGAVRTKYEDDERTRFEKAIVTGRVLPLKPADTAFDATTVLEGFPGLVGSVREHCHSIPPELLNSGYAAQVRLVVGKSGGVAKLYVNDIDLHLDRRCTVHIAENKQRFFPNWSGKEQSVTFRYVMP